MLKSFFQRKEKSASQIKKHVKIKTKKQLVDSKFKQKQQKRIDDVKAKMEQQLASGKKLAEKAQSAGVVANEIEDNVPEQKVEKTRGRPAKNSAEATLNHLIEKGKSLGFVTVDELNKVFSSDGSSVDKIDDTLSFFDDEGIAVRDKSEERKKGTR